MMNRFFSRAERTARLSFTLTVGGLVTMLGCAAEDDPADETPSAAPAYVHQRSLAADGPLRAARVLAREARATGREPLILKDLRREFADDIAAEGTTIAEDDVEAFAANDDVAIVTPRGQPIPSIDIVADETGEHVAIAANLLTEADDTIGTDEAPDGDEAEEGPETLETGGDEAVSDLAAVRPAPHWSRGTSGSYTIVLRDAAKATFTWRKQKLEDDGDARFDYWAYSRKATGKGLPIGGPAPITGPWDGGRAWSVTGLYMRNYATQATLDSHKLVSWMDWGPKGNSTGRCQGNERVSAGVKGASVAVDYYACDSYKFGKDDDVPGEASIKMTQKPSFRPRPGKREAAYVTVFKVKKGFTPTFHDQQQLEIVGRKFHDKRECSSVDENKTCLW